MTSAPAFITPDGYVKARLSAFPWHLRGAIHNEWSSRRNRPLRPMAERVGVADDGRESEANTWLRELCERFQRPEIELGASESDIREFARARASEAQELVRREVPLKHLKHFVTQRGLALPNAKTEQGIRARVACEQWWRRNIRRATARKVEALAINLRTVHRRNALYCSEDALKRHAEQRRRNSALLDALEAINELGDEFTLLELAEKSVSNPKIRRAELMTRVAGFEYIAQQCGLVGEFVTITAPSKFHAHHAHDGSRNDKWEGSMPRETQSYLLRVWARASAALARAKIKIFGFRVAEPHHDETPHFHGLFFMKPEHVARFRCIVARYAVREESGELGLSYVLTKEDAMEKARAVKGAGALKGMTLRAIAALASIEAVFWRNPPRGVWRQIEARVKFKAIDWTRGTAAGYIAKYIAKNIDGERADGESIGSDFESDGEQADAKSSAQRVTAWASTWGIRQFQQVGGPPVTVWRDLRRLNAKEAGEDSILLRAAVAADAGNWARFVEVMGGWETQRKDMPVKLAREAAEKPNRYGEEAAPTIIGVVDATTGQLEVTRMHEWVLKSARKAGPWTRVNNSTFSKFGPDTPQKCSAEIQHNEFEEEATYAPPSFEQFVSWAHEWAAPPSVIKEMTDAYANAQRHAEISRAIKQAHDVIELYKERRTGPKPSTPPRRTRSARYAKAKTLMDSLDEHIKELDSFVAECRAERGLNTDITIQ
ncbi:MAG: replication endonuclease [Betaproteobacteria bacterium]|nr:replication endonuclease [Betaproteobacteria bacterium]